MQIIKLAVKVMGPMLPLGNNKPQAYCRFLAFTLIEVLVVLFIIAIATRAVLPTLPTWENTYRPEVQWMNALKAAQVEARTQEVWIELIPSPQLKWVRWQWEAKAQRWNNTDWSPPKALSEKALAFQVQSPFPQSHIWIAPQRVLPFAQAVCLPNIGQCTVLSPIGDIILGEPADIQLSTG
ncbi:MAG: prepilin-type N-terminal cleavage/methylation domain-containing protein [Pseudomonadota bacterium]